jgi:hypothetical protein
VARVQAPRRGYTNNQVNGKTAVARPLLSHFVTQLLSHCLFALSPPSPTL